MKRWISILLAMVISAAGIPAYADSLEDRFLTAQGYADSLKELIAECETKGLDVGYERADCEIIKDFIGYGRQDAEWGDTKRAEYVADCLEELYLRNKENLEAYLTGTKKPKTVVKNYAKDYAGAENGSFVNADNRPVIFNGYGVFDMLRNDIGRLQTFGADIAQLEIGPRAVLSEIGAVNGWSSNVYGGADASSEIAELDANNCMKVVNKGSSGYLALTQSVSVRPNTSYTLSMKIKTNACGGAFFSAKGWNGSRCTISSGTNDWREYSVEYTTAADEYTAEILFVSNRAAEAVYIDDVKMYADNSDENVVQNGDFESCGVIRSEHFQANSAPIKDKITRALDDAYKSGVMVNVLISPHYFPQWILTKYPEAARIDCGLGYDINNPIAKEALELYIKALMQEIAAHPALHSICISNEPSADTRKSAEFNEAYSRYLREVYNGDINELNSVYLTSYASFDEVKMPNDNTLGAAYYDWVQFNDEYGSGWNRFLAETVKKYAPDVPVHAKIMTIFGKADSLSFGMNPEDFAEFCDYSGNDAWGFYGADASGLISKLMWYDLLASIKPDAPVINSEDHITEDGNENYIYKQAIHIGADIWQGAVHGRDASIIWIWNRTQDKNAATYGNILYRPDVLSQVSEKSLDINRLSEQVAALQNAKSSVSILYSPTTRAYSSAAVNTMKLAYEASLYAGARPKFVTERQLENGTMPQGTLIIPMVTNITDKAWSAISSYKKSGGRIVALGADCLARDEHNRARRETMEFDCVLPVKIAGNKVTSPDANTMAESIMEYTGGESLKDINGNAVTYVEKISAECGGRKLWNLCNYSWDTSPKLAIPATAKDLLSGGIYTDFVELSPFTPVLLEFCEPEISLDARASTDGEYKTVSVEAVNSGDVGTVVNISVVIKNSGTSLERADFRRYIGAHEAVSCKYTFKQQGEQTALITAKNTDAKRLASLTADIS